MAAEATTYLTLGEKRLKNEKALHGRHTIYSLTCVFVCFYTEEQSLFSNKLPETVVIHETAITQFYSSERALGKVSLIISAQIIVD